MSTATGSLARFGLIALLALALGALLLFSASPAGAQSGSGTVDYDTDGDNLIEVSNLAQLNAIRYDLDGNGTVASGDQANYDIAFPNALASMGCAATCLGYELAANLNFNTDTSSDSGGAAVIDADDDYYNSGSGWEPLGDSGPNPFRTTFEGNNHTISNLFINRTGSSDNYIGLFGQLGGGSVRRVHLVDANVTGNNDVGALVGHITLGTVSHSSSSGAVSGVGKVGGLVGAINSNSGTVEYSRSSAVVTATGIGVGGLVGSSSGRVRASYATGAVTGLGDVGGLSGYSSTSFYAVYATGAVTATGVSNASAGGLVGGSEGGIYASYSTGAVTSASGHAGGLLKPSGSGASVGHSYWDVTTTSIADDNNADTGEGKTTLQLQSPTQTNGYAGIYANWDIDVDSDSNVDDPWDFGTASQYPALKADSDGDGRATAYEFGRQGRSAPAVTVDYDDDDDGLIEVVDLDQLNAMRWDLDGDGAPDVANANDYALAFPNPATGMGCPITATDADDNDCLGYELTADLDFNTDTTGSSAAVVDSSDDYWNGGLGWSPIGSETAPYMAVFDGGRHTIANLFINRPTSNMVNFRDANKSNYVGLFASLMSPGEIRHLRLTGVSVTGRANVGAVVGHITQGTVSHVSSTGAVTAVGSSGGNGEKAGGLVGSTGSASVVIEYSYSTATVTAGDDYAGGLVGESKGEIRASYATGAATATGSYAGGLVGKNDGSGIIKASYATGAASGADHVGGLAGQAVGNILSSYSRGAPSSSSSPAGTNVGGLVGSRSGAGTITNSYWDVTTSGIADDSDPTTGVGKSTRDLQMPAQTDGYAGIYANWNLNLDGDASTDDDPWDFGTDSEYPALKVEWDGDGTPSAYEFGRQGRSAPNQPPAFDADTLTLSVPENTAAGVNIGSPVLATDPDGDPLYYEVIGDEIVYFTFDADTNQIKTRFVLDHESKTSYSFSIMTDDGSGGFPALVDVTINVTNVVEGATDSVDYDSDDDGLIEVDSLSKLDAMRYDLDGDGVSINAAYFSNNFTTPAAGMGCPVTDHDSDANTPDQPTCTGYELTADLDFNTDKTGSSAAVVDSSDAYWNGGAGWVPIGSDASASTQYSATFDGDGHTISNLFISRNSTNHVGLFGATSATSAVRNVGLESASVTGNAYTGALIGSVYGAVEAAYSTGSVNGNGYVGGLVASLSGGSSSIQRGYSTASVTGSTGRIGGLVGSSSGGGQIKASYATGAVRGIDYVGGLAGDSDSNGGITASYATGAVSSSASPAGTNLGGLAGRNTGTITNSYWNVTTTGIADDNNADTGEGKTTSDLQSPTQTNGYAGIYANWNLNLDSTAGGDDPWDFGTASQYPALKADFNRDSVKSAADGDFGRQPRAAPGATNDYDTDDNGLIEVADLDQLNAMRWDLNGDGASTDAGYATAFPNPETGMGCPITAADADDNDCLGYELTANLDFDTNGSGTANLGDTYYNGGAGWEPIGTSASRFNTVFDGRGYTISNLFISRGATDYVGLFGAAGAWIRARNVGLEDAAVTGQDNVGILLGETNGEVEFTYTTGSVVGRVRVGGLVGNSGRTGSIETSYSTASVTGTGNYSGGLIGQSNGAVKASYATGAVGGVQAGGLVGRNYYYGAITASYARGAVTGTSVARGLVASTPILFGLPGQPDDTGTVTDSYWDVTTSGIADDGNAATGEGKTTSDLQSPTQTNGYAGIYANWNLNLDGTAGGDDPWDFGTASQYPALKADFNRDSVKSAADGDFGRQPRAAPAPANNPPVFTAGYDDTPNIAEGETAVGNYAATDPESDALTYAVTGTDAAAFAISGAGVLTLNSAANHETKSSYIVSVTVHDGKDAAGAADTSVDATLDLTVTVDDTLEPPGVPTGVNVVGIVNGLRVSWTAADAAGKPAVSFWVQYAQRTSAGPPPVWDSLTPISVGGVTTYDITGLTPGETYQVFVRAVNAEGNSLWTFPGQDVPLAPPVVPPGTVDYDRDDDGLIDVDSLAKLNAVRWDLDGNGASANAGYATAFPNPETGMGCPVTDHDGDSNTPDQPTCTGYELTADLDFDTHGNDDTVTAADAAYWNGGSGWDPIGSSIAPFAATFDGAGHAIANLFINRGSTDYIGLFRVVGDGGRIRNLGLERVKITGRDFIGAVAGEMSAFSGVEAVYVTGAVSGRDLIGGLIGEHHPNASLRNTYSAARVTGSRYVGGLLGYVPGSTATVYYSYARGVVSGLDSGGLLYPSADQYGINGQQTYWDTQTTGQATSNGGTGQTTSNLKSPTGATGIYSDWPTATWDFGTAIQYPALKYDTDGDGAASWQEFGRQRRSAPAPANNPPVFTEGATASRSVLENTVPNRNIGLPVAATDADSDALTYALSPGQDGAHFAIVSSSGQLRTKEALNYENNDEYSVTVTVSDGNGGSDSIAVTITVDNESEPPGAPTGLAANPMSNGLRVTWTAPGMAGKPALTRYDVEYKLSAATAWTPHSHTGTGTTARITGLTVGATYNVRVRAVNPDGSSGWASANGIPRAPGLGVDYDTDDDGLIEIDNLAQLNAMRWDADGDGAGGGSGHAAAFPNATAGMGCPSDCTGYELEADLNFDTNGSGGANSGDTYWNGGMGWAPFWYYGTFEGNRHTISNLYVNRPDSDYVGLFSTAGAYAEVSEVRNLGLENVDVTGREYAGGLAGRAHAPVRRVYTTGEVNGEHYVGGLVGEARNLISETYSKADVSGDGWESSNVGGLVGYLRLGTVKASYATGDVSAVTWVGGLVGHNSSSDDGGIIASYATGNLGFGGLEDADPPPGRWVDGFSSRYYLPYTPTWVGGLVGDSSGPIAASYSTGGHPISLAGFQPGERKDRSRRDLAYMMEVHWKIGGLIGKSYGRDEHDSYWDTVTSRHRPGDKDWVYGEGKTTEELQWVTGYTGIYANWNVDLDGDGIGDDPWDFGSSAHYPTLKVDWDGDGTATSYEFGGQGRSLNDHLPSVAVGGTGVFEVTVPENTPSGAPIFGVTLPLAPADASSYNLFVDAQWPDGASFNIDATTGQLSAMDALDYESRDTYRIGITAVATDGARHSNGIIIRVTDVAEPPGPPTGVTIVSRKGSLEVSWTAPDMAGKPPLRIYEVTYYHDGDKAKITGAGTTTYTMTHLTPLITYAVQVRARNVDGWGPDSAVAYGTPYWFAPSAAATGAEPGTQRFRRSAPPPGQPANLRATPQTDGSTLVTWDPPTEAGDDAFYRVRRRVDAADSNYQVIARRVEAADSGGVVAYRDEGNGREAGQRYLYSVRAFDGDGEPLGRWTPGVRDNRPPAFAEDSAAAFQVAENTAAGTAIGNAITATDPDDGDSLIYLLGGADADHFAIDADSGQLRTSGALDYESQDSYAVTVIAADGAGLWAGLDVTITVTDVQEAPAFSAASITRQVAENTAAGANIGDPVAATDSDGDSLTYSLGSTAADGHFTIDSSSGQLQTSGALDYESTDSYTVTVTATDGGGLSASIDVTIKVDDMEETGRPGNVQAALQSDGSVLVTWNAPAGAGADTFYRVRRRVDAADSGYQLIARRVEDTDNDGAAEYRDGGGDLEAGQSYIYSVRAFAGSGAKLGPWTEGVSVAIPAAAPAEKEKRAANAAPSFSDSAATVSVAENTAAGTNIGDAVAATDPDGGDTLTYTLGSTADDGHFAVDSKTGQLQTSGALDYESKDSYTVTVTATDGGGLTASIAVTVTVDDVADTAPGQPDAPEIINIKQTSFRITWTAPTAGSSAITGYGIQYKLSSEADSAYADAKPTKRGTVTGYNLVNRNGQSITAGTSYAVRMRAKNAEGWGPWSDAASAVTASPAPAANNPPSFADSTLEVSVAENTATGADIGSPVTATDPDAGDTLTYTLGSTADDGHFAVDSKTGQLQTKGALDYENQSSYAVTVTASDSGGLTASIAVTIKVDDVADTPPGQPDAPEIINIKQTSFRITWTAPAAGSSAISGYGIQYKLSSEADSAYADAKPTKRGTVTGYNVVDRSGQSITAGTSYDVRVRARNDEGWGAWSKAAIAVTASPDPPPDTAPANGDEAEAGDSGQEEPADAAGSYQATAYFVQGRVRVEWDDVDGAKRYTVQKNGQLMPGWFIATAFFDGDVEENTRYEYRITA